MDENHAPQGSPSEVLPPEEELQEEFSLFDYLTTPEGNGVAGRILGIFESIQNATITTAARQRDKELSIHHTVAVTWHVITGVILVATIACTVWLAFYDKLNAAVTGFFGLLVGYLLGAGRKQS